MAKSLMCNLRNELEANLYLRSRHKGIIKRVITRMTPKKISQKILSVTCLRGEFKRIFVKKINRLL